MEGCDVLRQGIVRIGDGVLTRVMQENLIPRDHMLRPVCMESPTAPVLVSKLFVSATRTWDVEKLQSIYHKIVKIVWATRLSKLFVSATRSYAKELCLTNEW